MDERLLNRLKIYRATRDWTQAELAEAVGVTRKSINAIERGRFVPSTELALKLAGVFGVSVEDLFRLPTSPWSEDEPLARPSRRAP